MERNLRKTRVGVVVSDKMDKTIVVAVKDSVQEQVLRPVLSVHVDLIGKRTRLRHSADVAHRHAHQGTCFRCFQ